MDKLVLSTEGVFPVTNNHQGELINKQPNTGLAVPGTVQGEGKLAGVPSLFVRLSSCNLRCIWQMDNGSYCRCDTTYASFHPDETLELTPQQVVDWLRYNAGKTRHVVLTGGEPLLQKKGLASLCKLIKEHLSWHITIESNGTLFDNTVAQYVDLFSISPKLQNSNPTPDKLAAYQLKESGPFKYHNERRRNIEALQNYINLCNNSNKDLQLKFVVGKASDVEDIKSEYLNHLSNVKAEDILLMPLGAKKEELAESAPIALSMAIANGWRYSPRVHIELFGSKIGV